MAAKQSIPDQVAEEIALWIETTATAVADAVLESALAPQVVSPTREQLLTFFKPLYFLPDGSPNQAGRDFVMHGGINPLTGKQGAGFGVDEYETVALALAKSMQDGASAQTDVPMGSFPPPGPGNPLVPVPTPPQMQEPRPPGYAHRTPPLEFGQ